MQLKLKIRKRQTPVGCKYSKDIQVQYFDEIDTLHPDMRELVKNSTVEHDESQEPAITLFLNIGKNQEAIVDGETFTNTEIRLSHMFHNDIDLAGLQGYVIRVQDAIYNKEEISTWSK